MAWVVGIGIALFLLLAFPRQVLSLAAILVVAACAIGAYYWAADKYETAKRDKIIAGALYDLERCSQMHPIYIVFKNNTSDTITRLSFSLEGYREGYSDPVSDDYLSTDKIIKPQNVFGSCWRFDQPTYKAPINGPSLEWRVKITSVRWQ